MSVTFVQVCQPGHDCPLVLPEGTTAEDVENAELEDEGGNTYDIIQIRTSDSGKVEVLWLDWDGK